MPSYTLEIEAFGVYNTDIPTLEIWEDGSLDSSHAISSNGSTISVTINYGGTLPTSLELRFNDGLAEGGRTIEVRSVKINDKYVNTSNFLSRDSLTNGGPAAAVDINNADFIFDSSEPAASEFTTGATRVLTAGNDTVRVFQSSTQEIFDALAGRDVIMLGSGDDKVNGNDGNDYLRGGTGNDLLFGEDGNDLVFGQDGNDRLYGGTGADRLHGGNGDDEIHGGADNDRLNGNNGNDIITGGAGDDSLGGGAGDDYLFGGTGVDTLIGAAGVDTLDGGAGNDLMYGGAGDDVMNGGDDDDIMIGDIGNDTMHGDDGNDTMYGRADDDTMYGGDGDDRVFGGQGDDILDGGDDDDVVMGGSGLAPVVDATTILSYAGGQDGASTLTYFPGGVTMDGNPWKKILINYTVTANTVIEFDFYSTLEGDIHAIGFDNDDNIDNDTDKFKVYGTQNWNRDHDDFNNYDGSGTWNHYTIDVGSFFTGTFSHLTLIGDDDSNPRGNGTWANITIYEDTAVTDVDTIDGGAGDDQLFGNAGNDTLNGGAGADVINGNAGVDVLNGDAGNDILHGGNSDDTLSGGNNNDELYGGAGDDTLNGGNNNDLFDGGTGTDTATFAGHTTYVNVDLSNLAAQNTRQGTDTFVNIENLIGTDFNDTLRGDANTNQIDGGLGNDNIWGNGGADVLNGEDGDDNFFVQGTDAFDDIFNGDAGFDEISQGGDAFFNASSTFNSIEQLDMNGFRALAELNGGFDFTGMTVTARGNMEGQGGNETITGSDSNDLIYGFAGNDILNGGIGNDQIWGGDDVDTINGGVGNDIIRGEAGADILNGDAGADDFYISGNEGLGDTFNGGADYDEIYLEAATFLNLAATFTDMERVRFNGFDITAVLGDGFDLTGLARNGAGNLLGQGGDENISGTEGADNISGLAGNDTLNGNAGGDIINGDAGNDILNGGAGNDDLFGGDDVDTINGGANDDDIYGGAGADILNGDDNNDNFYISGTEGVGDVVDGGAGSDDLILTAAAFLGGGSFVNMEVLRFNGFDITATLNGTFDVSDMSRNGAGELLGQGGNESITGTSSNDTIRGFAGNDTLNGAGGADIIYGGDDADIISGDAGDDDLYGEAGADTINGGDNTDDIYGGDDADILNGDAGNDNFYITGTEGIGDVVDGGAGTDDLILTAAAFLGGGSFVNMEVLRFNGFDITADLNSSFDLSDMARNGAGDLYGQGGNEGITGTSSADIIYGLAGNDTLNGFNGDDDIYGGDDLDIINGGTGADDIYGGAGADTLNGDDGNDNFYITGTEGIGDAYDGGAGTDDLFLQANVTLGGGVSFVNMERLYFGGFNITADLNDSFDLSDMIRNGVGELLGQGGNESITGTGSDDIIRGFAGVDTLNGFNGNDDIYGGDGADILSGGLGDDDFFITGTESLGDQYDGGGGNDYIRMLADSSFNTANTFTDIDRIYSGGFNINLAAGTVIDFTGIRIENGSFIYGTASAETITGSDLDDNIYAGDGADILAGGAGQDNFYVTGLEALGDTFDGGAGNDDEIHLQANTSFNSANTFTNMEQIVFNGFDINIVSGATVSFSGLTAAGTSNIYGAAGAETITGTESADNIYAGAGADILAGGAGQDNFYVTGLEALGDTFDGGAGNDDEIHLQADTSFNSANTFTNMEQIVTNGFNINIVSGATVSFAGMTATVATNIYGAAGAETITGTESVDNIYSGGGVDILNGGGGNDNFYITGTEALGEQIDGGAGADNEVFLQADTHVNSANTFLNINQIHFGGFNIIVTSGSTVDFTGIDRANAGQIHGQGGAENITGMDNNDTIFGFGGNDTIKGGTGNDTIDGGTGSNIIVYDGDDLEFSVDIVGGTIRVIDDRTTTNGNEGSDVLSNVDTLRFNGVDYDVSSYDTSGNGSAQTIIGTNGGNTISAGNNDDVVFGGRGNDNLSGDNGNDTIFGGSGNDTIYGNDGLDELYGGIGADTFIFENANAFNDIDEIYDFDTGESDAIDITDLLGGYTFGVDDLTDFVQIVDAGADSEIYVDTGGTGTFGAATQIATLFGVTGLTDEVALETAGNLITN